MRDAPGRLARFASVGLVSTALYAALACGGTALLHLSAPLASVLAYALAGVFSYFAHRHLTFRSSRPHRETSPRFALVALWGYGVALVAPALLTDAAGLPAAVAVAVVSVAVPASNFILMRRVVFERGASLAPDGSIR